MLKKNCLSSGGVDFVDRMKFVNSYDALNLRLIQTNEFRQLILMETAFPASNFYDLSDILNNLRLEGSVISKNDFFELLLSLNAIIKVKTYLSHHKLKYPELDKLQYNVIFDENIITQMETIMDNKGDIKDSASADLLVIRRSMNSLNANMRNKIYQSLQLAKRNGWTRDDAEVTIRNGRAVIPMLAADKRKIKGFVHDESKTGQLIYLEPIELFDNNNELRELEIKEKQEINKILQEFTLSLKPQIDDLILAYRYLGMIDFIRSKAKLAIELQAIKPILNKSDDFQWREARHPLLFLSHKKKNKKVVPLNIGLNPENRILVISGPNAGGKSVCLKTLGLLQYMLQCGLLVSMKENSEARLFKDIFIDIGDEQSIENDLSTYSSHLFNIKNFIKKTRRDSLFLIDEFGTGTEPAIGGAIAEAALEALNNNGSYGVVTTHYSNLKAMANGKNGITNAAMLFDTKELRPLYKLKIGSPGSSFAFEIARKIGLDESVLQKARRKSGRKEIDFDQRLQEVELEKDRLEEKMKELEFTDNALKELVDRYEAMNSKLQTQKQEIIHQAKREAKDILRNANRLIERSVREIKENQAEKDKVKALRAEVEKSKKDLDKSLETHEHKRQKRLLSTKEKKQEGDIKVVETKAVVGDQVRIIGQKTVGILDQIKGKNAMVSFDSLKFSVAYNKLEKVKVKPAIRKNSSNTQYNSIMKNIHERASNFKPNIDVRGMRAEEALSFIRDWIDEAILISYYNLEILHGTGNGILRQVIRDYLSSVPQVELFKDAHIEFGGSGKTIIKLK